MYISTSGIGNIYTTCHTRTPIYVDTHLSYFKIQRTLPTLATLIHWRLLYIVILSTEAHVGYSGVSAYNKFCCLFPIKLIASIIPFFIYCTIFCMHCLFCCRKKFVQVLTQLQTFTSSPQINYVIVCEGYFEFIVRNFLENIIILANCWDPINLPSPRPTLTDWL